jgi:type II secretory pathway pseudopilin PulG
MFLNKNFVAPSLPLSPSQYDQKQQDQFQNALRLYFNRLDAYLAALSGTAGGSSLGLPFIEASDSGTQYATGNNTATIVNWDTTALGNGFTLNVGNTATAQVSGIYKITYSLQFANNDNVVHDAIVWLRINGSTSAADIANSTTNFTVPARKSAGVPAFVCGYSEVVFTLNAGDTVGLWWGTDLAATSGGATGVYIYSLVAQTTPMAYPATPSALGSITFVSSLPA